ncbi:hypothetical protein HC723_12920 [Vibrio sp. S11_S32]|uniref:hypothetical protein n=1 Tax=Vibrio sp. S11_S32 TaxID=2720225 RepID=UPI00168058C6|nr:hypothetical protein [Vibrio sp. S11_S32]MBD1577331.1 hypothetical protein [Vibrio sp. S11_S32]
MYTYLLSVIPPMLLGAQVVLLLILLKGDICPGQRGRIHKQFPIIAVAWLALGLLYWPLALVGALILFFFSQVKVKKTRDSGPIWLLYVAIAVAAFFNIQLILGGDWGNMLFMLVAMVTLGASLSHVFLLLARSRLQAFHRLLPVVAIIGAMLVSIVVLLQSSQYSIAYMHDITLPLIVCFVSLIVSVVFSSWHLFTQKTIQKTQPICGFIVSFSALVGFSSLLFQF